MHDWPHSPVHRLGEGGAYIVTAGTYQKKPVFRTAVRLEFLCETLLGLSGQHGWNVHAWAVFPNHYHFLADAASGETLRALIQELHSTTARHVNALDRTPGRKVWFRYWETRLTYQRSYLARLNYVHTNAVRHGLVRVPSQYPWSSAGWFERKASPAFRKTVMSFPADRILVPDDYVVNVADT